MGESDGRRFRVDGGDGGGGGGGGIGHGDLVGFTRVLENVLCF